MGNYLREFVHVRIEVLGIRISRRILYEFPCNKRDIAQTKIFFQVCCYTLDFGNPGVALTGI